MIIQVNARWDCQLAVRDPVGTDEALNVRTDSVATGFSPATVTGLGAGAEQVEEWAFVRKEKERMAEARQ